MLPDHLLTTTGTPATPGNITFWLPQLKSNREVSNDRTGNRAFRDIFIPVQGCLVHLKGLGWIKVFRTVGTNGDAEYWATSKLTMTMEEAAFYALDA